MSRTFPKPVKRAALERSGKRCEAVGPMYGLQDGVRCNADISTGFDFDHVVLWANSRDSSLDNVAVVCRVCHRFKTTKHDTTTAAETLRQQDKHNHIRKEGPVMPGSKRSGWKKKLSGEVVRR